MARIVVELENGRIRPRGYDPRVRDIVRAVPGMGRMENHVFPGYPDAVEAAAKRLHDSHICVLIDRRSQDKYKAPKLDRRLRNYQRSGVEFLIQNAPTGALLCDDCGLGKTVQVLAAAQSLHLDKILVVCPAVVKHVWRTEVEKWWPAQSTKIIDGTKAKIDFSQGINIVNYDVLYTYTPAALDLLVLDEVAYLSNERSRRSGAARAWANAARHRFGLSATPINARERDLWNPVETLSPGRLGTFWSFVKFYCGAHQETIDAFGTTVWTFDWPEKLTREQQALRAFARDELRRRFEIFALRRTKADVMRELPAQQIQTIEVDVPESAIIRLLDYSDRWALRRALDRAGAGKIPAAVALAGTLAGHSVVLFSHMRSTASKVGKLLRAPVITGEMAHEDRHAVIATAPRVLSATADSIGIGVDLSYADVAIFVDLDWVPSKILQLIGRLHRAGQKRPVTAYFLIARGTADERIRTVVIDRLHLYENVTMDREAGSVGAAMGPGGSDEEALAALRTSVLASEAT